MKVRCIHMIVDGKHSHKPNSVADFPDDQAKSLIESGAAVAVEEDAPAKRGRKAASKEADLSDVVAE